MCFACSCLNISCNNYKLNKTQTYYNISATYTQDQICAKVGYVATGKDGGIVVLDGDSPLANVLPTEQKTGIANKIHTSLLFLIISFFLYIPQK